MAPAAYVIGIDFGTQSARGVIIDAETGEPAGSRVAQYRHGVIAGTFSGGRQLPEGWALQDADDYLEALEDILAALAGGRRIAGIGLGFTASSPLPVDAEGAPLSRAHPREPHAYVKLWKHTAAQRIADRISAQGGDFLTDFGGRVSGEWLLAKAGQLAEEAPEIWSETSRFIEAGDWLVWQLTGRECRSLGFAAYKAQYSEGRGYPDVGVPGLAERLSVPHRIGSDAGVMSRAWRDRLGIAGEPHVAVAVIDSHVVLPAVGGVRDGCLVAALGTSAVYLSLSREFRPLPGGIEGVAKDGSVPGLWCYEAGQAAFGDTLAWFTATFPRDDDPDRNYALYNTAASELAPGESRLLALDWWGGNRVPHADGRLTGLLAGLTTQTSALQIYRALLEGICFGARSIIERFEQGGVPIDDVIVTSGLAASNMCLVQILADVLGRDLRVPSIEHPTAVGAAIHGAVAASVVTDFTAGSEKFGARSFDHVVPDAGATRIYEKLFAEYRRLAASDDVVRAMHGMRNVSDGAAPGSAKQ